MLLMRAKEGALREKVVLSTLEAIEFTIMKKRAKAKIKNNSRKALGFLDTISSKKRGVTKWWNGTLGEERTRHAALLWYNMSCGDPIAVEACRELMGLVLFNTVRRHPDGSDLLKKCMQSK